jgi:hypothetical protein
MYPFVTVAPQLAQNLFPGGISLPQGLQVSDKGDPQSPQKLLPFGTLAPQRGQNMPSSSEKP